MYLASQVYLSKGTEVRNLVASSKSVLSAIAQSEVYTSKDVRFIDNIALQSDGFVMNF